MTQRIALVTGGIGGLGTEICKHLARSGRRVVAADLASRSERVAVTPPVHVIGRQGGDI